MVTTTPPLTKSARIYTELKREITGGTFRPGEHLVRRALVKRYGVSLSIVNEALGRLGTDGLVESTDNVGTRVVSLSPQGLRDEFVLREAIERHVVRILAERATDAQLAVLLEDARMIDRWMNELGHDDSQGGLLHLEFHLKLARTTGFSSLESNLKRMTMRALLTTRWLKNQQLPHPPDFHEQLVRVLMQRDPLAADSAMRAHLYYVDDQVAKQAASPLPAT
jgi:DNA-binding GntR family transcriptional regulator